MPQTVVPMIHVPDVRAAVAWYVSIGFTLVRTNEEDGEVNWAKLAFEGSEIMLDSFGKPSSAPRREVDLYILSDSVDELYGRLKDRAQVVEDLHDTFYGMREFIIRDLNGFWLTFGQPVDIGLPK
jgi:uncharacterized glyoxalase superfamily protein PhnB